MPVLIRFRINSGGVGGADFDQVARALAAQGFGGELNPRPKFRVFADSAYPDDTVIEYARSDDFMTALEAVNDAIDNANVRPYCTGGDLHLPTRPVQP